MYKSFVKLVNTTYIKYMISIHELDVITNLIMKTFTKIIMVNMNDIYYFKINIPEITIYYW